ncbi:hypothetical protein [Polyangium aurulentum]|uniref:hypothetical protein n=1 Tax=Polyangium aurulentum TaxID=2567896 RepID=UPI0010AEA2A6|nr:hypothetical protein [Polyangium aurulentum]UQA61911.1 OprO/OprP family phosphate-selective porin [Polyangium aurulentum]
MNGCTRALAGGLAPLALCLSISLPAAGASPEDAAKKDAGKEGLRFHASLADGLGFKTAKNEFAVDAGVLSQIRFDLTWNGPRFVEDGFNVLMARPYLKARAFDDQVRFFVQPELGTTSPKLLDLEVSWQPVPAFGIKVGQFLTPFSRAFFTPVPLLQFQDFSRVNEKFRAGRDTGAMMYGAPAGGIFEYYAGAFNGNGIDRGGNDDTSIMGIGRIAVNPLHPVPYDETPSLRGAVPFRFAIGLNGIADRAHPTKQQTNTATGATETVPLPPETRLTLGGDITVQWDRLTFLGEGYLRRVYVDGGSVSKGGGLYGQAGFFVVPKHFEVAARVGWMDPDTAKPNDEEHSVEGLLNGYVVGNHLKMGLRYMMLHIDAPNDPAFKPGTNHRLIFQTQFWI